MQNHLASVIPLLAPYVNSYRRYVRDYAAPINLEWARDNRTTGLRVPISPPEARRLENRLPGMDVNPYLAIAAQIAAGIAGIENKLELEKEFKGDAYQARKAREIPSTLAQATLALKKSTMLRDAMGPDVIDHYVRCAEWELEDFNSKVTDYEVSRGFERA